MLLFKIVAEGFDIYRYFCDTKYNNWIMRIEENYSLEKHNTFHLPVKTRWFMEYASEEELGRILRDEYFQECLSLHIGGGSNLLFINDFNGIKLRSQI